jgi:class 3 adenylate cyclase
MGRLVHGAGRTGGRRRAKAQRITRALSLAAADWGGLGPLRARMGLHTGEAIARDGDYFGPS